MRAGWTISSIPATHTQSNQRHYFISNQKSPPSTQAIPTKIPEDYVANKLAAKPILPPTKSNSYFNETNSNQPLSVSFIQDEEKLKKQTRNIHNLIDCVFFDQICRTQKPEYSSAQTHREFGSQITKIADKIHIIKKDAQSLFTGYFKVWRILVEI